MVDEVDDVDPNDISYVYSGYAPLSIRLVQCVSMKPSVLATSVTSHNKPVSSSSARGETGQSIDSDSLPRAHAIVGWKGFEETVRGIPGATFDEQQKPEHGGHAANNGEDHMLSVDPR